MNYDNFKISFKPKSKGLGVYFFMLFFVFSLIISVLGYMFSQYLLTKESHAEIKRNLDIEYIQKKALVERFVTTKQYYLDSVLNNKLLTDYIKEPKKYEERLNNLFLSVSSTSPSIMQLRYIDKKGLEKIKVVRKKHSDTPYIINKHKLQNKSHRYYFKDLSKIKDQENIWFSKFDLNMEHNKIENPIVPTIRVAKPVILDGEFQGIVIFNIFAKSFIDELISSLYFKIGILDSNKEYIHHFNDPSKNWSSFFNERKSFVEDYCVVEEFLIDEETKNKTEFFTKSFKNMIPNNDIYLIFTLNNGTYTEIIDIQKKYILYFILFIFFISIPISILLSRIPFRYTKEILQSKHQLLNIIDEHVLYSSSDKSGKITDVSDALCKLTKYSRSELIGKGHNIFRHPDTPASAFQSMWSTILDGHTWKGEIKNLDKEGNVFWIDATITPNFDKHGDIIGFTAIRDNISDKKIIEALSITDELTTLYNKRYFNKTFPKEIKRAKRLKTYFVFVILDIDNFKLYNDTYGHKEGDDVLQRVGVLIQKMFKRSYDFAFRIGGEEFAIVFNEKDISKIKPYIERLRVAIENLNIIHEKNGTHKKVTASIGYRIIDENCDLGEEEIYTQADEALYEAKSSGRNKVVEYKDS